jgi:hypothetical protein
MPAGSQILCARQLIGQLRRFVDQDREMLWTDKELFTLILDRDQGDLVTSLLAVQTDGLGFSHVGIPPK